MELGNGLIRNSFKASCRRQSMEARFEVFSPTYMGLPAISLPLLSGENNLPLGVQLVGDKLDDLRFLASANWLEKNCKEKND